MYITTLKFKKVLEWFTTKSNYQYMMLFVSSYKKSDEDIVKYFIQEKSRIDKITGNNICFFHFVENSIIKASEMEAATSQMMLWHINDFRTQKGEKLLNYQSLRCGAGMEATTEAAEDICNYFQLMNYQLPAFILISQDLSAYTLFTVKAKEDLEAILSPVKVINSYIKDMDNIERRFSDLHKLESHEKLQCKLKSIKKEKEVLLEQEIVHNADELEEIFIKELISAGIEDSVLNQIRTYPQNYRKILYATKVYQNQEIMSIGKRWMYELKCKNRAKQMSFRMATLNNLITETSTSLLSKDKDVKIADLREEQDNLRMFYKREIEKELLVSDGNDILQMLEASRSVIPIILKNVVDRIAIRNQTIHHIKKDIYKKIQDKAFDVFISCKSEDYNKAMELYAHMVDNGLRPFIASVSIREIGVDGYGDLIRQVIDTCKHMVVFATKLEYISTPYVHAEWNLFLDEQTAGRKKGHLLSVISDISEVVNLPFGLRTKQCYDINNYKGNLCMFLNK